MVLDRAGNEHDPLAQQARVDVEAALAAVRLLDNDGNEAGGDVLMILGKRWSLRCVAPYIGRFAARFKAARASICQGRVWPLPRTLYLKLVSCSGPTGPRA